MVKMNAFALLKADTCFNLIVNDQQKALTSATIQCQLMKID